MLISEDITCQELVELVTDYFEGVMPPADRDRFEQHLVLCDGCASYVEQMRTTIALTGTLTETGIPADIQDSLLAAFRGWKR
jgi:anti-sigma factor RsiW